MKQSRVVDVSKAGVRQSAAEARAMCSQFGVVRWVHPWRAQDGRHHAFVEFQYTVSPQFRDRLAERTGFAVVRVGDSDALAAQFNAFNLAQQQHWPSSQNGWLGEHSAKHPVKKGAYKVKDVSKSKGKGKGKSPMAPSAVIALLKPMVPPAAPPLLDYGSPSTSKPSDASDSVARPLSSPLALPASLVHDDSESKSAGPSHSESPAPDPRQPLLDIRNFAPVPTPPIPHTDAVPSDAYKPHTPPSQPPPPPSSSVAPAPSTPGPRPPLLDIRNVIPSTEHSLTPKEPRHVLADLLVKNVTVQSFLTIATWYRDRNMLNQAAEIAKAALKEKRRRGELRRGDAMALNLFLSTVSTAYARACQPKESQKYMLEAARYINLAWAEPDHEEPEIDAAAATAKPSTQAAWKEGASAPAAHHAAPEPELASPVPQYILGRPKDQDTVASDRNLDALPVAHSEHRQLQTAPVVPLDRAPQAQESYSRASPASSRSSGSDSEHTVAVALRPMEEVDVRKMTLAEVLDMAGTLLKHAARLATER